MQRLKAVCAQDGAKRKEYKARPMSQLKLRPTRLGKNGKTRSTAYVAAAAGRRAGHSEFARGLFVAKSNHRIDFHGAAGRDVRCDKGDGDENEDGEGERQRIVGREAEEKTFR